MAETDPRVLARQLAEGLQQQSLLLATAESCTGGGLAFHLTDLPGSSAWFERGFVTYSNAAKREELDVPADLLERHGAVSEAVARAMADGALKHSRANVSVAITGIAGPSGGTPDKPVGLVWLAWAGGGAETAAAVHTFTGDRSAVREQAIIAALEGLLARLEPGR